MGIENGHVKNQTRQSLPTRGHDNTTPSDVRQSASELGCTNVVFGVNKDVPLVPSKNSVPFAALADREKPPYSDKGFDRAPDGYFVLTGLISKAQNLRL
jgi:hypothetical protein